MQKKIKANILKAFNCQFNGKSEQGIHIISNLIKRYQNKLVSSLFNCFAFRGMDYYKGPDQGIHEVLFYKGRVSDGEPYRTYTSEEMFHIPLNCREKTTTQRFSLPGIPCIYLAQNSYVVWKEINMPSFDKLSISAFKIEKNEHNSSFHIIDLTYPFEEVANILADKNKFESEYKQKQNGAYDPANIVISSLILFVLIAAVSVKCRDKNRSFKSEYVIPQLFMHALKKDIIGIAYHSNEVSTTASLPATNLAIPIIDYDSTSCFGRIKDSILLTEPINFDYYNRICRNSIAGNPKKSTIRSSFNEVFIKNYPYGSYDGMVHYADTPFCTFDDYILNMKDFKSVIEKKGGC